MRCGANGEHDCAFALFNPLRLSSPPGTDPTPLQAPMEYSAIKQEMTARMAKAVDHTFHEFGNLHTGKATPSMIENIPVHVEAYGSNMQMREIAAITTPDSRTLSIQPWDKNTIKGIEKAIQNAGLGLNPVVRGTSVVVPIPELSGDRRKELVKIASSHAEDGRVGVRQARHWAMEELKKLKAEGSVGEDDIKRHEKEVQSETDRFTAQINDALEAKEKELLQV